MAVKISQNVLYSLKRSNVCSCRSNRTFIRIPLAYMQLVLGNIKSTLKLYTHIVKTLKSAHTCCAYSYCLCIVLNEFLKSLSMHTYIFGMHLVSLYLFGLDRLECTGTHMQGKLLSVYTRCINRRKHFRCKMKSGCRCCYRAFNL